MFDFDAGKLLIIGVVALIVIGPKDLPRVLRQVGQAVGRLRRMASEFQGQFMDAMKEADIQDIRDEMAKVTSQAKLDVNFNPLNDIKSELTSAVNQSGPLMAPLSKAVTEDFTLPAVASDSVAETMASAGVAPVTDAVEAASRSVEPAAAVELVEASPADASLKKRKIVLPKRRVGAATLRSEPQIEGTARFRNVRPRRQEATEQ
jgi:sec-independent protein translocase protein TatB